MKTLTPRTIKKIGVYFILGMFLLSTILMSAMYFVDMQTNSDEASEINDIESDSTQDAVVDTDS